MKRILLASAALASILAISACKRDAEPAPAPVEPTSDPAKDASADAPPADVDVISEVAHAPVSPEAAAASSFDTKAYAGTFADSVTQLKITADGMFTLDHAGSQMSGTWTLEKDGEHLLFDPDSKSEPDRRYKMVGNDELQRVGGDNQRLLRGKI